MPGLSLLKVAPPSAVSKAPTVVGELLHPAETLAQLRPPIQCSLDIAVPLAVAWQQFERLEVLPEGAHAVSGIERDGSRLRGRCGPPLSGDWEAEVLDERPGQSFAWRSLQGSDCAGLITFHRLAERLTRIELNLDVVPTTLAETLALATGLADRQTENTLRRLKARLELISPDAYEDVAGGAADDH